MAGLCPIFRARLGRGGVLPPVGRALFSSDIVTGGKAVIAHICEQGARITREGLRLVVHTRDGDRTLFVERLEQLLLFGNVELTAPARYLLLREGVDTVFLRRDGRYMGRLFTDEPANFLLRKKQFALVDDPDFCVRTARCLVRGKLLNQATLLGRIKRSHNQPAAGQAAASLRALADKAQQAASVETLRGLEGSGAALYFRHLPLALNKDWQFVRRGRRPPTDPVNAVLSLLYTLLTSRCYTAVRLAGLDPYPASLHSMAYGRQALPLDLVEEFRPIVADTLTISLFNHRVLQADDFFSLPSESTQDGAAEEDAAVDVAVRDPLGQMFPDAEVTETEYPVGEQEPPPVDEIPSPRALPVLLTKGGYKTVIEAFAKKLETEFIHPLAERRLSYAKALVFQARLYRRLVEGEVEEYSPVLLR